ncbi:hypothetical protein Hdeb2414_s0023g00641121 [Helianthus debilis subsp. tardiflorus]
MIASIFTLLVGGTLLLFPIFSIFGFDRKEGWKRLFSLGHNLEKLKRTPYHLGLYPLVTVSNNAPKIDFLFIKFVMIEWC